MTRDPFLRLALMAGWTGYAAAAIAGALLVSPWLALAVPAGFVFAVVSTVELAATSPGPEPEDANVAAAAVGRHPIRERARLRARDREGGDG